MINVGLDTSGSMGGQGTFERVLSYVYHVMIEAAHENARY
jgi:hypothetical protein